MSWDDSGGHGLGLGFGKAKKRSKDEQIYGVFANEEEEDMREHDLKQGLSKKKGISFAAAPTLLGQDNERSEPATATLHQRTTLSAKGASFQKSAWGRGDIGDNGEGNSDLPSQFGRGNAPLFSSSDSSSDRKLHEGEDTAGEDEQQSRPMDAAVKKRLMNIEKHGKGVVLKMMEKMGFKDVLGKRGNGLKAALEPQMRGEKSGLGFGSSAKPKPSVRENLGEADPAAGGPDLADRSQFVPSDGWKKNKSKSKKQYKTAAELRAEADSNESIGSRTQAQPIVIHDMQGGDERIVSASTLSSSTGKMSGAAPEFHHNVQVLVEEAQGDIMSTQSRIKSEERNVLLAERESKQCEQDHVEEQAYVDELENVIGALQKVAVSKPKGGQSDSVLIDIDRIVDLIDNLRRNHAKVWDQWGLQHAVIQLAQPKLQALFSRHWDPIQKPEDHSQTLAAWKLLLAPSAHYMALNPDSAAETANAFKNMLLETILPEIRRQWSVNWNPRNPKPVVRFFKAWSQTLPHEVQQQILIQALVPRIKREVEAWDPMTDEVPLDNWLLPLLPVLGNFSDDVLPLVRQKFSIVLQAWQAADSSAMRVIAPWIPAFGQHAGPFLSRNILPKLSLAVKSMQINPAEQDVQPIKFLFDWAQVLPTTMVVSVLEADFFPRWHSVLYQWLMEQPNLAEIRSWYRSWLALFPTDVHAIPAVKLAFKRALRMIENVEAGQLAVQEGDDEYFSGGEEQELHGVKAPSSAMPMLTEEEELLADSIANEEAVQKMSFRDLMEVFAAEYDLMLMPKPGKKHQGKQVFSIGRVRILLDDWVVFVQQGSEWRPIGLDDLLIVAQA